MRKKEALLNPFLNSSLPSPIRHHSHISADGPEALRSGLHPGLHQDLPENPGLVPRLRLHAGQQRHGAGNDPHQVGGADASPPPVASSFVLGNSLWKYTASSM